MHHTHETARTLADMLRRIRDLENTERLPYASTDTEDLSLIKFWHDEFVLERAGAQGLLLTYKPLPLSERLFWKGLYQEEGVAWTRQSRIVTLTGSPTPAKIGDVVTVEYAYLPGVDVPDEALPVEPDPEPVFVGFTGVEGGTVHNIYPPAGWAPGDLVIIADNGSGATVTTTPDPRIIGGIDLAPHARIRWAILDESTAPFTSECTGSFLNWWSTGLGLYREVTVEGTAQTEWKAEPVECPVIPEAKAVALIAMSRSGTVAPTHTVEVSTPAKYTYRGVANDTYETNTFYDWTYQDVVGNPVATFQCNGTPDLGGVGVLRLVAAP